MKNIDLEKSKLTLGFGVAFLLSIVAIFMPWYVVSVGDNSISATLWDDTKLAPEIFLVMSLIGLVFAVMAVMKPAKAKLASIVAIVFSLLNLGLTYIHYSKQMGDADDLGVDLGLGLGFFLAVLSLIAALVLGVMQMKSAKATVAKAAPMA